MKASGLRIRTVVDVALLALLLVPTTHPPLAAGPDRSAYQVGAYYFGAYTPSAANIVDGTQRVYGRKNDWWGGVEDFYGAEPGIRVDHRGWPGEWPDLKPAIGFYDQRSVNTLEQQINQAADAGLAFFSFYWYWSNAKRGEALPEALSSFLHARNRGRLKFNLTLYAHPWDDDMAIGAANADDVATRLVGYFADPQYLRLPDGRPVFSIGDDRNIRRSTNQKCTDAACNIEALTGFIDLLRRRSIDSLGIAPFIQVQVGVPGWDRQPGVDGLTCLGPPVKDAVGGAPYPVLGSEVFAPLMGKGKPVSPCMLVNFDERPRQDILIADRNAVRYFVGKTDATFRHNLTVAKEVADAGFKASGSAASRIVYLYAWNEWHEGGILEPRVISGAHDLDIVSEVFGLPRGPSVCLDHGRCGVGP